MVRLGSFVAAAIMLVAPTASVAADAAWTVSDAAPGVTIRHGAHERAATRGLKLSVGDVVQTAANARAVLVSGETYAMVAPNSRLEVSARSADTSFWQFFERMGNVVFSVRKSSTPHFGVRTPYLAAVVKGTTFSVAVDDRKATVQVIEGAVEVDTVAGAMRRLLHAGGVARVFARHLGALTLSAEPVDVIERTVAQVHGGSIAPPSTASRVLSDLDIRARVDRMVDRMGIHVPLVEAIVAFFLTFGGTLAIGAVVGLVVALAVSRWRLRSPAAR